MNVELWAILMLAFGLGMLHALDADHIMAVSGLSCQQADGKSGVAYCTRWALGHGAVLILLGAAVMFMGMAIPVELSAYAESAVGVMLIMIGLLVLFRLYRQGAHLHFHRHDGIPDHAHWHIHHEAAGGRAGHLHDDNKHQHSHAPVLVGVLHGTAGTAPLLALLPLSQLTSPWLGMTYLLLFGLGVFLAMLMFGGVLGRVFGWLQTWGNNVVDGLRMIVSLLSIGYGLKLVMTIS